MNLESWIPLLTIGATLQTIRIHLRQSPAMREFLIEGFGRFQIASLALLYLKNSTKAEIESDLDMLIAEPEQDDRERTRRKQLLQHVRSAGQGDALQMAKYGLENARILPITAERTG